MRSVRTEGWHSVGRPVSLTVLAVLVAVPILAGGVVAPARAEPAVERPGGSGSQSEPTDPAQIAAVIQTVQDKLGRLTEETETATERFNAGRIRLADAEAEATRAAEHLQRADTAVRQASGKRRDLAGSAYRAGGFDQISLLFSGDPASALDRAGAIDALARRGRSAESELRAARHEVTEAREAAAATLAEQTRVLGELSADKQRIESAVAEQQGLLTDLEAKFAELERQAREREEAARRAAQEQAAREAAASAAAAASERARVAQEASLASQAAAAFSGSAVSGSARPSLGSGGAAVAVREAFAQLGKPYVWAAAGPNTFDCSGLTQWAWGKAGVALSHYTGLQWNEGTRISRANLVPGDLVFFGKDLYHVGIYIGDGKMIHAPHTGDVVKVGGVWWDKFAGAVRPGG